MAVRLSWTRLFKWALALFLIFELLYVARIAMFIVIDPSSSPYIRAEAERLAEENKTVKFKWVDYDQISPYVAQAVVAAEDANFMNHFGIEPQSIKRAFERNVIKERTAPGGSTLTQQTIKNLFLSHDRSYLRKAQEIVLSPILELLWSKKRILEVYLNIAEFGNGVFGIEAAAEHYYHKKASALTRSEAIWLASILVNPKRYEKTRHSAFLDRRIRRITADMPMVRVPKRN